MERQRIIIPCLLAVLIIVVASLGTAWAERDRRSAGHYSADRHSSSRDYRDSRSDSHRGDRNYVLDDRHRHNRYYPRKDYVVKSLPRGSRTIVHGHRTYYYDGGVWYRPSGLYFSVIAPPIGVVVPVLPPYYTTVWAGSYPYYYADGAYYAWNPRQNGYVVTTLPQDVDVREEQEVPEQLYVYPKRGQDTETQSLDRYECHRWAVQQTGFDPTRPGGNVPANENRDRREDYARATKACLEARDYSVQ